MAGLPDSQLTSSGPPHRTCGKARRMYGIPLVRTLAKNALSRRSHTQHDRGDLSSKGIDASPTQAQAHPPARGCSFEKPLRRAVVLQGYADSTAYLHKMSTISRGGGKETRPLSRYGFQNLRHQNRPEIRPLGSLNAGPTHAHPA